jgi:outer membrane protein insertion porin family
VPFTVGWARDSRDSSIGADRRVATSASMPNGHLPVMHATFAHHLPVPAVCAFEQDSTRQLSMPKIGWGKVDGWSARYPVFKNFYGGGLGSVRGFEQGSLGPQDISGTAVGGCAQGQPQHAEVLTPFPGAGNDRTLRMYGFLDVGMVGGAGWRSGHQRRCRQTAGIRWRWASAGFRRWTRCGWRLPSQIRKFDNDKIQSMQFQIGTSF